MPLNKKRVLSLIMISMFIYTGCEDDHDHDDDDKVVKITEPATYTFNSRFADGVSSVSYSGQVVRNLLINDIKTQMGTDAGTKNPATLVSMMANDNADRAILSASGMTTVQTKYHDISTSHLNDRLTAVASYTIPGYDANAGALVNGWVQETVANGKTRATGIRLDQMTQKTLWGAISYWQATSKYMSKIPGDDNTVAVEGKSYTAMEHHWDESFGYFGAALDYNTGYTDDNDRKSSPYFDSNSDGKIDFKTEYNVGWAVTAAKRDLCTGCDAGLDFTKTIFDAYIKGRTMIVNQEPLAQILEQRDLIMATWEKVVAAVTIHYINDVIDDIDAIIAAGDATVTPASSATADYENHWGEMRGYANGLLYNDFKKIATDNLNRLYVVMGTVPVYPTGGSFAAMQTYQGQLKGEAKAILKASYGFSDANMDSW
ncbi:MAG: hypothetical protein CMG45_00735 [Candidatus Marinimicrobia bacterium]|nr:hypothetical protein [Candidatus Neomarinimicrobiota bacterium]